MSALHDDAPATQGDLERAAANIGGTIVALENHLDQLRNADNQRIEQRFTDSNTAINAALASQEKAVGAALQAAKEAAEIVRKALEEYKVGANEWRAASKDLIANMPTKKDLENLEAKVVSENAHLAERWADLNTELIALREWRIEQASKQKFAEEALRLSVANRRYTIGLAIGLPAFILAIIALWALIRR